MECDGQRIVCLRCEKYSQTFPCDIMPMESALEELLEELQADVRQHLAREIPMLILTNAGKHTVPAAFYTRKCWSSWLNGWMGIII